MSGSTVIDGSANLLLGDNHGQHFWEAIAGTVEVWAGDMQADGAQRSAEHDHAVALNVVVLGGHSCENALFAMHAWRDC